MSVNRIYNVISDQIGQIVTDMENGAARKALCF